MNQKINDAFDSTIGYVLILSNPFTWVLLAFIGIYYIFRKIWIHSQIGNLYFYFFTLRKIDKPQSINNIIQFCNVRLNKNISKWERYVLNLIVNKSKKIKERIGDGGSN